MRWQVAVVVLVVLDKMEIVPLEVVVTEVLVYNFLVSSAILPNFQDQYRRNLELVEVFLGMVHSGYVVEEEVVLLAIMVVRVVLKVLVLVVVVDLIVEWV